jgi:hypothetical protein
MTPVRGGRVYCLPPIAKSREIVLFDMFKKQRAIGILIGEIVSDNGERCTSKK